MPDRSLRARIEEFKRLRLALETTQAEASHLHERVQALIERDVAEDTTTASKRTTERPKKR